MLPEMVLDNEDFDDMMAEARNMIISLYPEWTDFNYHDPGITLIELFSWLRESQHFYMDQISAQSREKYLKLLGISRRPKIPASVFVQVVPMEDITVLAGTKLYAGDICFETDHKKQLIKGDAVCCVSAGREPWQIAGRERLGFGHNLHMPLFGLKPVEGDCFYIGFDHSLPPGEQMDLYLELSCDYAVKRNPLKGELAAPMADIRIQYYSEGEWLEADGVEDETGGAIASGQIHFRLRDRMEKTTVFGEQGFFLRLVLRKEQYDIPPILEHVSVNRIPVIQRESLIEQRDVACVMEDREGEEAVCQGDTMMILNGRNDLYLKMPGGLRRIHSFTKTPDYDTGNTTFRFKAPEDLKQVEGVRIISVLPEREELKFLAQGSGFPFQEYTLNDGQVEYESFQLMVQEKEGENRYIPWDKVPDFSSSGPESRHYVLDSQKGEVRFGNCIRGMAPEGNIIITSRSRTLGRKGNVKAYKVNHFDGMAPEDMQVYNWDNCRGGRDEESQEESFLRARRELKHPDTAVTDRDYERYVMETPGLMLENCKVIPASQMNQIKSSVDEMEIHIVVNPFFLDKKRGLNDCYRKNILAYLEGHRMVGRKITLLSPQYVSFELYADIVIQPHYVEAQAEVRRAVEKYFSDIHNQFGITVQYSDLYGKIDMMSCVVRINSLSMDAKGTGLLRGKDGSITLPPNGVALLGEVVYMFGIGE